MDDEYFEHSLKLEKEKYYYRRISGESFFLKKELGNCVNRLSIDITGSRAIIGTGRAVRGSLCFLTNHGDVYPPSELFGIFIPPYSIYRSKCDFEQSTLSFLVTSKTEVAAASSMPVLFSTVVSDYSGSDEQTAVLLSEISGIGAAPLMTADEPAASAAKNIIDKQYSEIQRISTLAGLAGIESWELSRLFKQSYGISPLRYLNNIRTIETIYRLLEDGKKSKIIDVAFNVGFRDLSRFNKQFKSFVNFIPRNLLPKTI
ncbi:MAG: helix-turn-helix transcriptional regulator [Spirochaetales bacterium]|nr:helix-turn-helix transcriptional regulator [Spirochaetales bacterium]